MAAARAREDPAPDAAPRRYPQAYRHRLRPGPQPPRPAQDQPKPLSAPQWTKLVKAAFKTHVGVPLAPKELRSSFITFLRSGDNSDAALKSAAFAMRHSSAQARGPAYDKERSERLSAAAVQVATDFAAGFK